MINISNFSFKIWFYAVSTVNEVSLKGTRWLPFSARQSAESLINYTSCEFAAHSVVAVDTVAVSFSYTHFSLFPHISPYCTHICHWTWSVVLHARTILLLLHLCCIIHHIVIEETRVSVISLSMLIVLLKNETCVESAMFCNWWNCIFVSFHYALEWRSLLAESSDGIWSFWWRFYSFFFVHEWNESVTLRVISKLFKRRKYFDDKLSSRAACSLLCP